MSDIERARKIIIELGLWFDRQGDAKMCDRVHALLSAVNADFLREVSRCTVRYQKPAFSYHTVYISLKMVGIDDLELADRAHAGILNVT